MRKILTLMAIAILALSQWAYADSKLTSANLAGTWELEYALYKNDKGDVVGEIKDKTTLSRKILSEKHFAFITWDKAGKFSVAASGTYSLKGPDYSEIIDATSEARLMGKTYHFNAVIKSDLWIHKGLEDGILIEEHWRRVQ
jgi:hypothetical protein